MFAIKTHNLKKIKSSSYLWYYKEACNKLRSLCTWSWPSGWCIGLRSWLRGFDAQLAVGALGYKGWCIELRSWATSGWCIGLRNWLRGFDAQLAHLHDACASLPQKFQTAIKWLEIINKKKRDGKPTSAE